MDLSTINWLAVFVAALSCLFVGGLWYSPILFAPRWMKELGFTEEDLKKSNMGKVFGLTFFFCLVMAANLAMFLNDAKTTAAWGATAGFLAGFGWVAMSLFVIGQFERRSAAYMLIHAGYVTISFTLMGLILGAWR